MVGAVQRISLFSGGPNFKGISIGSLSALAKTFKNIFPKASLEFEIPKELQKRQFLVFSGGNCSEWEKILSSTDLKTMKTWFEKDEGRIFAVCAGAYFCSDISDYKLENSERIIKKRELNLFPGTCKGPAFSSQLRVVKVQWERTKKIGHVAIVGGGVFIPSDKKKNYQVLARLVDKSEEESIAVVKCQIGNGLGIISSLHWEWGHLEIKKLENFEKQIPKIDEYSKLLENSESFRKECLEDMMQQLAP